MDTSTSTHQTLDEQRKAERAQAFEAEITRAAQRRAGFIERPLDHTDAQWALCLSGGGIRSATFCLGVMQAVARSPGPVGPRSLLHQFDHLSTVSGGGYVGGFVSSLFVPGRLAGPPERLASNVTELHGRPASPQSQAQPQPQAFGQAPDICIATADLAAQALAEDPPGRIHSSTRYEPLRPGRAALAWLRDNGRYLAPTGAGDFLYAVAMSLRNWVALHYVMGTVLCLVLALATLARLGGEMFLAWPPADVCDRSAALVCMAWSSLGLWVLVPIVLAVLPLGVAFWFSHQQSTDAGFSGELRMVNTASNASLALAAALLGLAWWASPAWDWPASLAPRLALIVALVLLIAQVWFVIGRIAVRAGLRAGGWHTHAAANGGAVSAPNDHLTAERVWHTRWLTRALMLTLALGALAVVDTAAATLLPIMGQQFPAVQTAAFGAGVWALRALASHSSALRKGGWLKTLPWGAIATVAGVALWMGMAVLWQMLLLRLVWGDTKPPAGDAAQTLLLMHAGVALALSLAMAWVVGRFFNFVNLSTLQGLYSARITRAYLGASNHNRFAGDGTARALSVADPIPGDQLSLLDLTRNPRAPNHLINVCLNQTVDPAEQLVQRDRKGRPLAVQPQGFWIDGRPCAFAPQGARTEDAAALSVGEWLGVSGAAVSTGLGRETSLGLSLVLGFANVRLGRWWVSGQGAPAPGPWGWLAAAFPTQACMLNELLGRFYGRRRRHQYLSDGGHFENTAAYEMLRPERGVRLAVVVDCGADPAHHFDDLANLVRLVRTDHNVELKVNRDAARSDELQGIFGLPSDWCGEGANSAKACAILVDVSRPSAGHDGPELLGRLIVIKPRMVDGLPPDIDQYHATHADFPQEPTSDQFYDEAQWESYRKLGLEMARRVFPADQDSAYAKAFWACVLAGPWPATRHSATTPPQPGAPAAHQAA